MPTLAIAALQNLKIDDVNMVISYFIDNGFKSYIVESLEEIIHLYDTVGVDCIILDSEFIQYLENLPNDIPALVFTRPMHRDLMVDYIREISLSDYVFMPAELEIMVIRIQALINRKHGFCH